MIRKLISLLLILILTFLCILAGCNSSVSNTSSNNDSSRIVIVTSFYPLYISAMNITKDVPGVELVNMTPPTTTGCLHDYQLVPQDLKTLHQANVFVVNGAGMESFTDRVVQELPDLKIITASEGYSILKDANGEVNPHIWVSIDGAIAGAKNISSGLASIDPSRADYYLKNQEAYVARLESLGKVMSAELTNVKKHNIVTFHEAFPYFARDFNLNVVAVLQEEPDSEPSPQEIRAIVDKIKLTQTDVLFTEPQYSGNAARLVARETGARVFELDPVVTGPSDPDAYINIMMKNLATLKEALN